MALVAAGSNAVEERILALCREAPGGLEEAALSKAMPDTPLADRASALNSLLQKRRLQIFRSANNVHLYKELKEEEAAKFKGLTSEDTLVYQIIQASGNMGIWTRDLKARSNLQQPSINKTLKALEARKLVKSVKSVASKSRKLYMLFELEPSREITGGAWYTHSEFDAEFIDVLRNQCYRFIHRQGPVALEQICELLRASGLSKVELSVEDIQCLLNTLVFDGLVDEVDAAVMQAAGAAPPATLAAAAPGASHFYRAAAMEIPAYSAFTAIPCGVCPVINECHEKGIISPATCVYYQQWLTW